MNILYISKEDPRDTSYGSAQRNNLLWTALQDIGNVYAIRLAGDIASDDPRIKFVKVCDDLRLGHRIVNGLWRRIMDLAGCRFFRAPIYPSSIDIKELYPGVDFDVIVCRYLYPVARLHLWRYGKVCVDIDDHPMQVLTTTIEGRNSKLRLWFAKKLFGMVLRRIEKNLEGGWIANSMQCNLVNAKRDVVALSNLPNKFGDGYNPEAHQRNQLMTIGMMSYGPNYEGVDEFIAKIWPTVHQRYPELNYVIGGKGAPESCISRWNATDGVKYIGFVDDLAKLYQESLATVVPVQQGGGTCIKTLESLANSRVCMTTFFGARGISPDDCALENGIGCYSDADSFCGILDKLMIFEDRKSFEHGGLRFTERMVSREAFNRAVSQVIAEVCSHA